MNANSTASIQRLVAVLMVFSGAVSALAEDEHAHNDVEFEYRAGKIAIEFGGEGRVFEGEFPVDGEMEQASENPGFGSELAEGLGVSPLDIIDYNVLGPLVYHNGTNFAPVPGGASILIEDNPVNAGSLAVTSSTTGPISGPGAIAQADLNGEVHTHLEFFLEPASLGVPEYGAYGFLMQLTTDRPGVAPSAPFYLVFNFGLEEQVFEGAVESFAAQIPEPSTLVIGALGMLGVAIRKRR